MFNFKYVLLYISYFTLYLLLSCQAVLAENDQFKIFLKSRQFIPETSLSTTDAIALKQLHAVNNEDYGINKVHVIVQLTRIPNNEQKEQWKDQGIELLSYIPNNAWYAAISVPIETVAEHVEVRSVVMLKPTDKIEPKILNDGIGDWAKNPDGTVTLTVIFYEDIPPSLVQAVLNKYGNTVHGPGMLNDWVVNIPETSLHDLASEDPVKWVNEIPSPPEDFNDGARAAARVNSVQAHIDVSEMDLSGDGVNVGMWETSNPDVEHIDFGGRVTIAEDDQESRLGRHATHVAGTLGGDGNQSINNGGMAFQWRGTAPGVELYSYTTSVKPYYEPEEHESAISVNGIDLSNNSWGPAENLGQYDGRSVKYDKVVRGLYGKQIPIIFAAGNKQKKGPFGTISPGGGTAKNTITVGATNSNDDTLYTGDEGSSQGPTNDGRIKPDVVAPGCEKGGDGGIKSTLPDDSYGLLTTKCGTSFATPVVSGTIALMLERYREIEQDDTAIPLPSTYKGILIHTAKDLGNPGPDYQFGYGRIDAKKAIQVVDDIDNPGDGKVRDGKITSQDEEDFYTSTIESSTSEFKVTLAWDDFMGDPAVVSQLVNDLDLVVVDPNGTEYLPWILDKDNPAKPAIQGTDNINNVEQVVVNNPIAGEWTIKVKGSVVPEAPQSYSLVMGTETPELLLTANDQHTIDVRLSNGDGSFGPPVSVGTDYGANYSEFAIADFDGDGQLDFIASLNKVSTNDNPIPFYLFTRTGPVSFQQTSFGTMDYDPKAAYYLGQNRPLHAPDYGLGLIAADLDNDGDMDFLENINHDFGGNKYWIAKGNAYLNDGSSNFTSVKDAFDFHNISTGWTLAMSSNVVDVDGDGYPDMLASEQTSGGAVSSMVYLLKGNGDGTFQAPVYVFTTNHDPATHITLGDFNNDGNVDAIVGQDDDGDPGAAFLFFGHGDGSFEGPGRQVFDVQPDIESGFNQPGTGNFQAYDADGDGVLDIISAYKKKGIDDPDEGSRLVFIKGKGNGYFETPVIIEENVIFKSAFTAPMTYPEDIFTLQGGDLNHDGCVDRADLTIILTDMRGPVPHDPYFDLNGDRLVNIVDARKLVTLFSNPRGEPCN